jgi:hypothetical protein
MVDFLDNFQNLLKLFLASVSYFMKSLWRRMGWGKERKKNWGTATANQGDRWGERAETKAFANRVLYNKKLR